MMFCCKLQYHVLFRTANNFFYMHLELYTLPGFNTIFTCQIIPDSIAWQETLEELDMSLNQLESLPETIGLLQNLKILNVSGNLLTALPDSISYCR